MKNFGFLGGAIDDGLGLVGAVSSHARKRDRGGRQTPSFPKVLEDVVKAWEYQYDQSSPQW